MPHPSLSDFALFDEAELVVSVEITTRDNTNTLTTHYLADQFWNEPRPSGVRVWDGVLASFSGVRRGFDPVTRAGLWSESRSVSITLFGVDKTLLRALVTQSVDGTPCYIRIGRKVQGIEQHFAIFAGVTVEVQSSADTIVVVARDFHHWLNKALISNETVGGAGSRSAEPLPLIVGGAQSAPLIPFNEAALEFKAAASSVNYGVTVAQMKDWFLVRENGNPLYEALTANGITPDAGDPTLYNTVAAHGRIVNDVIEIDTLGTFATVFVVAVPSTTQLRLSLNRGGAAQSGHANATPGNSNIVARYGYRIRADKIVQMSANPAGFTLTVDCLTKFSLVPPGGGGLVTLNGLPARLPGTILSFTCKALGLVNDSDFDTASLAAADAVFDATYTGFVGAYVQDRANSMQVISGLLQHSRAHFGFTRLGKLTIGVSAPLTMASAAAPNVLRLDDQFSNVVIQPLLPPYRTVFFKCDQNQQTLSVTSASLSLGDSDALKRSHRMTATGSASWLQDRYPNHSAKPAEDVAVIRATQAGADKWATNAAVQVSPAQATYQVTVMPVMMTYEPGDRLDIEERTPAGTITTRAEVAGVSVSYAQRKLKTEINLVGAVA